MIAMNNHNPILQGGGWQIEATKPERRKDRSQAIVYRLRGKPRRRRDDWTPSEEYAYRNDLWIPEVVSDHVEDLSKPPHERDGIVRLMQVWLCYGGLLADSLDELGDALTQAIVVKKYNDRGRRVVSNGSVVGAERRERLIIRAGGLDVVQVAGDKVEEVARNQMHPRMVSDIEPVFAVGSGEPREHAAALDYIECMRIEGVGRKEMMRRLNLEGWENVGGIRRWNTHNVAGNKA